MNMRKMAILQAGLLLGSVLASAAPNNDTIRIKVLDSETQSVSLGGNDVPKNCDQLNYDAYCNSSKNTILTNTLLVQTGNEPPFHISCTIESKFSRCVPLPKGESFDARKEKRGLTVYYEDDKGKARKQFYALVDADAKSRPEQAATVPNQAAPVAPTPAPMQNSPAPAAVPPVAAPKESANKVQCNFTSTPAGAEIMIDGKYVGNTPSQIAVSAGAHVVAFNLSGFMEWKRDITVEAGSGIVNVTAGLQKTQP